jgi:hypothetical protein
LDYCVAIVSSRVRDDFLFCTTPSFLTLEFFEGFPSLRRRPLRMLSSRSSYFTAPSDRSPSNSPPSRIASFRSNSPAWNMFSIALYEISHHGISQARQAMISVALHPDRVRDFRIVCELHEARQVVLVVGVGHRKDVYK